MTRSSSPDKRTRTIHFAVLLLCMLFLCGCSRGAAPIQPTPEASVAPPGPTLAPTRIDGLVGPATWNLLFPIVKKQSVQQSGAKAVQALLNLNGYSVGTPDGLFGTGSETKLIQFQSAKGLTADGLCGAQTWAKLCEI